MMLILCETYGTVPLRTGSMQFCDLYGTPKTGTGIEANPTELELPVPVPFRFRSVLSWFFFGFVYRTCKH